MLSLARAFRYIFPLVFSPIALSLNVISFDYFSVLYSCFRSGKVSTDSCKRQELVVEIFRIGWVDFQSLFYCQVGAGKKEGGTVY